MADFRSKAEKASDKEKYREEEQEAEYEAQHALRVLEPQIRDYKAEVEELNHTVAELRKENITLHSTVTETLKTQMAGVEDIKGLLIEKMENLSNDLTEVHTKIRAVAESDMQLVKQLNDNQQQRLEQLSQLAKD